ncbi:MAG TPA: hypothetical protein VKC90_13400 [Chitinophagaceae bacterium]|nr:hypothetical protein [Chitinophagaceae bacterium]
MKQTIIKPENELISESKESESENPNRQVTEIKKGAFQYLESLPRPGMPVNTLLRDRDPSQRISMDIAHQFTDQFRSSAAGSPIDIPLCWSFDKDALIKLLGITSYEHYSEVNGVRFYAGVNESGVLTLIAVSTTEGTRGGCSDCRNDLTEDDKYPYYDYADPCPTNCSETGNLKADAGGEVLRTFQKV